MSLNFFQSKCQEPTINHIVFGLCDDENGGKAYTNTDDTSKWIATVKNDSQKHVVFTAIDKCVLFDNEYKGRGRCDGMLTTTEDLYLVELKNKVADWQPDAIEQLVSTIQFLVESHDIGAYKKRKAFACNRKRKRFAEVDNELNLKCYRETGFRIDVQAEIVIM